MIPKPPPREGSLGFLYLPPFRVQGFSMAGEATCVMVPELDVCFDIGHCPRAALASRFLCISHGHMDHVGGLAYWCSQRNFQGMGPGTVVCDKRIAGDIRAMMQGFAVLERQQTPYELIEVEPGQEIEIKNNVALRCFATEHTCPSVGYVVVEKRTKLKEEFTGLPQEKLKELKDRGTEIVNHLEIPLVAYTGDTLPGPALLADHVRTAQVIITECTFFEPDHRERARQGMHMHCKDIAEWLRVSECKEMVIGHISRRTNLAIARKQMDEAIGRENIGRVHFLMDHKANKARYEKQEFEAQKRERELARRQG
jgi:ribonuclease Z